MFFAASGLSYASSVGEQTKFLEHGFYRDGTNIRYTRKFKEKTLGRDNFTRLIKDAKVQVSNNIFTLADIKKSSLFDKVGLKDGDILKSLNGNRLNDLASVVILMNKLKHEGRYILWIERRGQPLKFSFTETTNLLNSKKKG